MKVNNAAVKILSDPTKIFIALMLVFAVTFLATLNVLKADASLEEPEIFVQNQTSKVVEKKYFNLVLSRIPLEVETFDSKSDEKNWTIGVDTSTDRLDFGIVPIQSPARKLITLSNDRDCAVKFQLTSYGNISQYIVPEDNNFVLESHTKKDLIIHYVGADETGTFTGELDVLVKIPKSPIAEILLRVV